MILFRYISTNTPRVDYFKLNSIQNIYLMIVTNITSMHISYSIAQRAQGETKATAQTEGHEERLGP